jgi:hypothetical protein
VVKGHQRSEIIVIIVVIAIIITDLTSEMFPRTLVSFGHSRLKDFIEKRLWILETGIRMIVHSRIYTTSLEDKADKLKSKKLLNYS